MDNNDILKLRQIKRGLQLHTQPLGLVQLITSHTDAATERKEIGDMLRSNMRLGLPNVHKMIRIMLIIVEDDVIAVPLLTQAEEQIRNLIAALSSGEATLDMMEACLNAALSHIDQLMSQSTPNQEGTDHE